MDRVTLGVAKAIMSHGQASQNASLRTIWSLHMVGSTLGPCWTQHSEIACTGDSQPGSMQHFLFSRYASGGQLYA